MTARFPAVAVIDTALTLKLLRVGAELESPAKVILPVVVIVPMDRLPAVMLPVAEINPPVSKFPLVMLPLELNEVNVPTLVIFA